MIPIAKDNKSICSNSSLASKSRSNTTKITPSLSLSSSTAIQPMSTIPDPLSPVITSSYIYPNETPPTQADIDIVRYTWERILEIRLDGDDPNVSSSHLFGLAFYDALFKLDPSLQSFFTNIFQQARAFAGIISYIARAPSVTASANDKVMTIQEINARKRKETNAKTFPELVTATINIKTEKEKEEEDVELLLHKLRMLGARHYTYNVRSQHLLLAGSAILKALKKRLGKEFLPEVAEAWAKAYAYAEYHMMIGLESQANWEKGKKDSASLKVNSTSKSSCLIQ
ncbi:uncharacterized protein BX663DRAFT_522895 [Cokeromyces recurvatus]|uniref:uncharacterized protein n=1 Tax=Cokeromyces recurvatus TaxID=90255 RepID=UPI0022202C7D|nr:uncharacterized protein BX663DRAFT_522895 [Cokeromyces recurvatus]KAI7899032.1 hypothetical protein BX663DRAFT_522895 [Cokeromyces recurvatus]